MGDGAIRAFEASSSPVSVDNTTAEIVPAKAGKKIAVFSYVLICSTASVCTWKSGTTPISGAMSFAANGGAAPGGSGVVLITNEGEALNLTTTAEVTGHVTWAYKK